MKRLLPLLGVIGVLFFLRLSNLSIRLSDTNIYFYTAYELLNGKLLYKDIFFTNLPLFPYLSSLYLFISNKQILFYYFTPTIEISIIALLIYFITFKKTDQYTTSLFSSLLYILSFMVLSTSEHQTGVFLASLFAVLAYLFWEKKNYILTGSLLAITIAIKAYFLPIILSFFAAMFLQKKYKANIKTILAFISTSCIILLPFLLFARSEIYNNVITYSLTRLPGVSKIDIFLFFITHDFIFLLLLVFNLCNYKKSVFFSCVSFFSIIFFFFYADSYYLYFNFLIPFLCLSLPLFMQFIDQQFHPQKFVIPTILCIFLFINFFIYLNGYKDLGKIYNFETLQQYIRQEKPSALYGVNDITPALAYTTQAKLLNNIVDTNESIFRKQFLNANELTKDAINQKALIITHGAYYPQARVSEQILDNIFNKELIKKHCTIAKSVPVYTEGVVNQVNIFRCK